MNRSRTKNKFLGILITNRSLKIISKLRWILFQKFRIENFRAWIVHERLYLILENNEKFLLIWVQLMKSWWTIFWMYEIKSFATTLKFSTKSRRSNKQCDKLTDSLVHFLTRKIVKRQLNVHWNILVLVLRQKFFLFLDSDCNSFKNDYLKNSVTIDESTVNDSS